MSAETIAAKLTETALGIGATQPSVAARRRWARDLAAAAVAEIQAEAATSPRAPDAVGPRP